MKDKMYKLYTHILLILRQDATLRGKTDLSITSIIQ